MIADQIFLNGSVVTMDPGMPEATAFGIVSGRFCAVGSDNEIHKLARNGTKIVDLGGKTVIRGTRVPIVLIIGEFAGGMTKEEIMREYEITEDDIVAALNYVVELIEAEEFHTFV